MVPDFRKEPLLAVNKSVATFRATNKSTTRVNPPAPDHLTVFLVVKNVRLLLFGSREAFLDLSDGVGRGERSVEEFREGRLLHHLRPAESDHLTESLIAVDDGTAFRQGIGHHKAPICNKKEKKRKKKIRRRMDGEKSLSRTTRGRPAGTDGL